MSEGGPAPAAPAVNGTPAPNGANGAATPITEATPAKKTAWDFTKDGPMKYRVSGKEKAVDNWDDVTRRLASADAYETKARSESEARQKAEARAAKIEAAKNEADPEKALKALMEELGEERFHKLSEHRFRALLAKEEQDKALPPEAKRWKDEAERAAADKAKFEADLKKRDEEAQTQQHREQTQAYAQYLDGVIGEALDGTGLTADSAPYFMPAVAAGIHRAAELGLEVTPQSIAKDVFQVQHDMATNLLGRMSPDAVVDLLEQVVLKADGKPDTTMRKAMMLAWHQRTTRKSVDGETPEQKPAEAPALTPRREAQAATKKSWAEVQKFLHLKPPLRTK